MDLGNPLQLYRTNAFRMTGLPVDVRGSMLTQQTDLIRARERDDAEAIGEGHFESPGQLGLQPAPTYSDVRRALTRIKALKSRLDAEVFWFWPATGLTSGSDAALVAVARGDVRGAERVWLERGPQEVCALHNLAVLAHLQALDFEWLARLATPQTPAPGEQRRLWERAQQRWGKFLSGPALGEWLRERVATLDDPSLEDAAAQIEAALPRTLALPNAYLGKEAVMREDPDSFQLHDALLGAWFSGREQTESGRLRDEVAIQAADELRRRIKACCQEARADAARDPTAGDRVIWRLLDQAQPLIASIGQVLGDHSIVRGLRDELAEIALGVQIAFAEASCRLLASRALLEAILPVPASPSVAERIRDNLDTIRQSLATWADWPFDVYEQLDAPVVAILEECRKLLDIPDPGTEAANLEPAGRAVGRLIDLLAGRTRIVPPPEAGRVLGPPLAYCLANWSLQHVNSALRVFDQPEPLLHQALADEPPPGLCGACRGPLGKDFLVATYERQTARMCRFCAATLDHQSRDRRQKLRQGLIHAAELSMVARQYDPSCTLCEEVDSAIHDHARDHAGGPIASSEKRELEAIWDALQPER